MTRPSSQAAGHRRISKWLTALANTQEEITTIMKVLGLKLRIDCAETTSRRQRSPQPILLLFDDAWRAGIPHTRSLLNLPGDLP